ncbi:MAG: helix-hairpin-helix domain-containing protein [Treponemataceae bacterium]
MEFTQEKINELVVDEIAIMKKIAEELNIRMAQVSAVISLVNEGCTIPFISRYRKEVHGSLDEVQVRDCDHLFKSYKNIETRRIEIIKGIFAQNKLTESLYEAAMNAKTLTELEDLWAPFKKKKKTRGMIAIEKGLDKLADAMLELDNDDIEKKAEEFIKTDADSEDLNVPDITCALAGAQDILAERISQDSNNRSKIHDLYLQTGFIKTKGIVPEGQTEEQAQKLSTYQMYWDFEEPLNQVKSHRTLAINRAEREGALDVIIDIDVELAINMLKKQTSINNKYHEAAIEDGIVRLLSPAVVREIRSDLSNEADIHGIGVFSENLKNLLMQQPIKGTRVLGMDPGIKTGTKCAAMDETGKYLGNFKIFQVQDPTAAYKALTDAIDEYDIQLVAVGNGTGSHEVQELVAKVISENYSDADVMYTVVDESGASVYSASDTAREEFPDLDLTVRGAISMGRRIQDPLAELVKIDPKAIGVGLYQHDVNQKKLGETLDEVVGSVVNQVGVNLNTASYHLLKYVSGINSSLAKKIVAYRDSKGKIKSRDELREIGGMGEKSFEQCAGFLKIPESKNPLDNTWVHPENYALADEVMPLLKTKSEISADLKSKLTEKYGIGDMTIKDIIDELQRPNRDPREGYPKPIMQKGVVNFEDLHEGMKVTGKIKNVVDFGAFVDIGLHETGLIHISELSDNFVSDPMEVVKVGDIYEFTIIGLDFDRKRISLSLKSDAVSRIGLKESEKTDKTNTTVRSKNKNSVRIVVNHNRENRNYTGTVKEFRNGNEKKYSANKDSGETYNPFAALLKK